MTNFSKYDVVVVKFPFASSLKYKARPAVVISSGVYNQNRRGALLIMTISSQLENKLDFELELEHWQDAGLLKPSVLKSAVATIEKEYVLTKLGQLSKQDKNKTDEIIQIMC